MNILLMPLLIPLKALDWLSKEILEQKYKLLVPFVRRFWFRCITPNRITCFRLTLAPIIIFMLFNYPRWHMYITVLFLLGVITDFLDGIIAEALEMQSRIGSIIDPLADKLLVIPVFLFILGDNYFLFRSLVCTEGLLVVVAVITMIFGIDARSNRFGKWKFTFQTTAIMIFFVFGNVQLAVWILWASVALGINSIIGHIKPFFKTK